MNWAWATSLDQVWRSPAFPMWLTLAAAGFFGFIVLITLLRADRSVANGALTVITLLAIGVAVAATLRGFGPAEGAATADTRVAAADECVALPALSCIDDLAGETVLTACEKALFGSSESVAAAVSYTAARIDAADRARRRRHRQPQHDARTTGAAPLDRTRPLWTGGVCAAGARPLHAVGLRGVPFADRPQPVAANMEERIYDGLVTRYSPSWNAPAAAAAGVPCRSRRFPPSMPTGRPTNAEFPTAASTPPVSIMNPEPGRGARAARSRRRAGGMPRRRIRVAARQETARQNRRPNRARRLHRSRSRRPHRLARRVQRLHPCNAVDGR